MRPAAIGIILSANQQQVLLVKRRDVREHDASDVVQGADRFDRRADARDDHLNSMLHQRV